MITTGARFLIVIISILGGSHLITTKHYWWGGLIVFVGFTQILASSQNTTDKNPLRDPTLFSATLYAIGLASIVLLVEQNHPWLALAIGAFTFSVCNVFSLDVDGEGPSMYWKKVQKATLLVTILYGFWMAMGTLLMLNGQPGWGIAVVFVIYLLLIDGIE